jgi:hypothetical protein
MFRICHSPNFEGALDWMLIIIFLLLAPPGTAPSPPAVIIEPVPVTQAVSNLPSHHRRCHPQKHEASDAQSIQDARVNWRSFPLGAMPLGSIFSEPSWREAQEELAAAPQDLELDADAGSLELMARTGFHPDFMTALYH